MDNSKVKNWNEAKYRIVHWVLEKMREVPIGKILAEGYLPSSLLEINALLREVTITALLPYETYGEGVFVHENTQASCYFFDGFIKKEIVANIFDELLIGQIFQICMIKNTNKKTQYVVALSEKVDLKTILEGFVTSITFTGNPVGTSSQKTILLLPGAIALLWLYPFDG